jgi:hypothetical protein
MPSANNASACRLHLCHHRQADLPRQPIAPLALEIQPFEQYRWCAAHDDDVAADGLQVIGDLLDSLERIFEGLSVATAKTNECRHDLHPFGRSVVPEVKAFAAMRRFDQSDACTPPKHVISARLTPATHVLLCHP